MNNMDNENGIFIVRLMIVWSYCITRWR